MSNDDLSIVPSNAGLGADIRRMIHQTRNGVVCTVDVGMTLRYRPIGKRIKVEVLENDRAEYGKEILATASQELAAESGRGSVLMRAERLAEIFSEYELLFTHLKGYSGRANRSGTYFYR